PNTTANRISIRVTRRPVEGGRRGDCGLLSLIGIPLRQVVRERHHGRRGRGACDGGYCGGRACNVAGPGRGPAGRADSGHGPVACATTAAADGGWAIIGRLPCPPAECR